MKAFLPGDTVKRDRIARSSRDLHNLIGELQDRGRGFVSVGDSWCDTTSDVGRLVLAIMGGIAEFERELIRKRCQAGIDRAKAQGYEVRSPCRLGCQPKKAHCRALCGRRDNGRAGARV